MTTVKNLPRDDLAKIENQSKTKSESEQPAEETSRLFIVAEKKALLHESKTRNKAGRPIMQIHEPRIRFNTGDTIKLHPEEILTDGDVPYYQSFDQPNLFVRKRDVSPVEPLETQNPSETEFETEQPAEGTFRMFVVTEKKALFHEIKTRNKAGRPVMQIHEPRIRFAPGDKLKLHPEEILTDGDVPYYQSFDQSDLYIRKKDVARSN